jgi:hypothetical protein
VHNSRCHITDECREIKKIVKQLHEQQKKQSCHNGTPPRQWAGMQHIAREGDDEEEMEFQNAKRAIKVIYDHSDFESSDNERRGMLHVIYGVS